jgi:hypothetical protein
MASGMGIELKLSFLMMQQATLICPLAIFWPLEEN